MPTKWSRHDIGDRRAIPSLSPSTLPYAFPSERRPPSYRCPRAISAGRLHREHGRQAIFCMLTIHGFLRHRAGILVLPLCRAVLQFLPANLGFFGGCRNQFFATHISDRQSFDCSKRGRNFIGIYASRTLGFLGSTWEIYLLRPFAG